MWTDLCQRPRRNPPAPNLTQVRPDTPASPAPSAVGGRAPSAMAQPPRPGGGRRAVCLPTDPAQRTYGGLVPAAGREFEFAVHFDSGGRAAVLECAPPLQVLARVRVRTDMPSRACACSGAGAVRRVFASHQRLLKSIPIFQRQLSTPPLLFALCLFPSIQSLLAVT